MRPALTLRAPAEIALEAKVPELTLPPCAMAWLDWMRLAAAGDIGVPVEVVDGPVDCEVMVLVGCCRA